MLSVLKWSNTLYQTFIFTVSINMPNWYLWFCMTLKALKRGLESLPSSWGMIRCLFYQAFSCNNARSVLVIMSWIYSAADWKSYCMQFIFILLDQNTSFKVDITACLLQIWNFYSINAFHLSTLPYVWFQNYIWIIARLWDVHTAGSRCYILQFRKKGYFHAMYCSVD